MREYPAGPAHSVPSRWHNRRKESDSRSSTGSPVASRRYNFCDTIGATNPTQSREKLHPRAHPPKPPKPPGLALEMAPVALCNVLRIPLQATHCKTGLGAIVVGVFGPSHWVENPRPGGQPTLSPIAASTTSWVCRSASEGVTPQPPKTRQQTNNQPPPARSRRQQSARPPPATHLQYCEHPELAPRMNRGTFPKPNSWPSQSCRSLAATVLGVPTALIITAPRSLSFQFPCSTPPLRTRREEGYTPGAASRWRVSQRQRPLHVVLRRIRPPGNLARRVVQRRRPGQRLLQSCWAFTCQKGDRPIIFGTGPFPKCSQTRRFRPISSICFEFKRAGKFPNGK